MMPAPGDQHTPISNPFQQQGAFGDMALPPPPQQVQQAPVQRLSEYTAQEIATLQSRLEKQLGPEYLSARAGPSGQKVHYIAAEKVIGLANEVFGFNGWSSSIQNIQIDFVDEHPQTLKISVGLSVIVRVTLRDGAYHEDIGYGHIENCKGKAAAFEKAKKEGTTDALKRALRNFGNVLGNCIYDKTYVDRVSKMKATPTNKRTYSEESLHRHADYVVKREEAATTTTSMTSGTNKSTAPAAAAARAVPAATGAPVMTKQEASTLADTSGITMDMFDDEFLGDFDEADFCVSEEGHPDEVVVPGPAPVPAMPPPQRNSTSRNTSPVRQIPPQNQYGHASRQAGAMPPRHPQTPTPMNGRPNGAGPGPRPYQNATNNHQGYRPQAQTNPSSANGQRPPPANNSNPTNVAGSGASQGEGTPWLSARAVAKVGDGDALAAVAPAVQSGHLFNPKAESPSIRKTPGIDHTSSKPVPRSARPAGGSTSTPATTTPATSANGGGMLSTTATAATAATAATTGAAAAAAAAAPSGGMGAAAGATGLAARSGVGHPMAEPVRRIGAPPSTSSPLANRGQFRPPPMKRGPPNDRPGGVAQRALAEVPSNVAAAAFGGTGGIDAKRQKMA